MDKLFIFEDFYLLNGQQLRSVLENLDSMVLAKSLKGARKDILNVFLDVLEKDSAVMLEEDIEYMGPVLIVDIEEAQEKMIRTAFDVLSQDGRLTLGDGRTCVNDFSMSDVCDILEKFSFVDKEGSEYEFDFSNLGLLKSNELEKLLSHFSAEDIYVANKNMGLALDYFVTRRTKSYLEKKYATVGSEKILGCQKKIVQKMVELISSGEIKNPFLVEFCNLVALTDRDFQKVLREVDEETVVAALKFCDDEVRDKVYRNVSKKVAEGLKKQIRALDCTEVQVKDAQEKIVEIIRRLEDTGEVVIAKGSSLKFII